MINQLVFGAHDMVIGKTDISFSVLCIGDIKDGINLIFDFVAWSNKYFDDQAPWALFKTDLKACNDVLYNCVNIIYNLNNLLKPYLPKSSEIVDSYLNQKIDNWGYKRIEEVNISSDIKPLYERYDKSRIDEEIKNLKGE